MAKTTTKGDKFVSYNCVINSIVSDRSTVSVKMTNNQEEDTKPTQQSGAHINVKVEEGQWPQDVFAAVGFRLRPGKLPVESNTDPSFASEYALDGRIRVYEATVAFPERFLRIQHYEWT
ncbi:hypothetical protein LguiB_028027 [Lonicera macranthoides]